MDARRCISPPRITGTLLALTLVWAGSGLGRAADAPAPIPIRIATIGQDANAEPFYAQELGIFKKYGIAADITVIRRGGGAAVATAVAGNAVDVGEGDTVTIAQAHEHGVQLVMLAPSSLYRSTAPTTEVIVATDSPIQSAKDLEGKTVALISLEGPSRVATDAWIASSGAALDKVSYVELPPINMAAAVERGTVAAAVINEPSLVASQNCCRVLANSFASVGKEWLLTAYFATADWVQKNPDAAKRIVLAIRETAQWANQPANHAKSAEILEKYTPFPPELVARMTRATYGETFSLQTMQPILDAAFKYKALKAPVSARTLLSSVAVLQ